MSCFVLSLKRLRFSEGTSKRYRSNLIRGLLFFCWGAFCLLCVIPKETIVHPIFFIPWNLLVWSTFFTAVCTLVLERFQTLDVERGRMSKAQRLWIWVQVMLFVLLLSGFISAKTPELLPDTLEANLENLKRKILDESDLTARPHRLDRDHHSKFNYSIYAHNSDWNVWTQVYVYLPESETGYQAKDFAHFGVVPIFLNGKDLSLELFAQAAMKSAKINSKQAWKGTWTRQTQDGFEGFVFNFEDKINDITNQYLLKVIKNKNFGYVLSAWADSEKLKQNPGLLESIHDRTVLQGEREVFPDISEFSLLEKIRHSNLYENVGTSLLRLKKYDESLGYLKEAQNLMPEDEALIGKVVLNYVKLNQYGEAKDFLSKRLSFSPKSDYLYQALERLVKKEGSVKEVLNEWEKVFDESEVSEYKNEDAFYAATRGGDDANSLEEATGKKDGLTVYGRLSESEVFSSNDAPEIIREEDVLISKSNASANKEQGPAGAFYELISHEVDFTPGETIKKVETRTLVISNPLHAEHYRYLHFLYNPESETLKLNQMQVLNGQGQSVYEGVPSDAKTLNAEYVKGPEFKGMKVLQVPVPEFYVAKQVNIKISKESLSPKEKLPFLKYRFDSKLPARIHRLSLKTPILKDLNFQARGSLSEDTEGDSITWTFENDSVSGVEVLDSGVQRQVPIIWIAKSSGDWESEGLAFYDSMKSSLIPNDRTANLALNLTETYEKKEDKLLSLYRYMQKDILFKKQINIPDLPGEIMSDDRQALEQSIFYFARLLASAGFDFKLVLVRTKGGIQEELPAIEQLNHMLVLVKEDRAEQFIDITYPSDHFKELSPMLLGRKALILDATRPFFRKIEIR